MKTRILTLTTVFAALSFGQAADPIVVEVGHSCCNSCKAAARKALANVRDVSVDEKKGTITAKGKSDAKKAVEILMDIGFHATYAGAEKTQSKSSGSAFSSTSSSAAKKVKSATVSGIHNCCNSCRNKISDTVKEVPGVTGASIEPEASTFTVQGDFSKDELLTALNKAGFNAKVR